MTWFRYEDARHCILTIYVQPGAKKTEVAGMHGDALKIRLAALPIEGRANTVLLKFVAQCFEVPRCQVILKQGGKSRQKIVSVSGSRHSPNVAFSIK